MGWREKWDEIAERLSLVEDSPHARWDFVMRPENVMLFFMSVISGYNSTGMMGLGAALKRADPTAWEAYLDKDESLQSETLSPPRPLASTCKKGHTMFSEKFCQRCYIGG